MASMRNSHGTCRTVRADGTRCQQSDKGHRSGRCRACREYTHRVRFDNGETQYFVDLGATTVADAVTKALATRPPAGMSHAPVTGVFALEGTIAARENLL